MRSPLYYALCTTERQFHRELRRFKVPRDEWPSFQANEYSNACVQFLESGETGRVSALVCIPIDPSRTGVQVAALLVHEAVHLWQWIRRHLGEHTPGDESEAYAVQEIAQNLMEAYAKALP